ncbi:zinc finger CCCH domain-containing protein 10-like [Tubulanus polymorphus]|uniref:zinc finger CCCH domain-containing protein 10-like n=1 Tax=Tubulanus polymorphus TaxID=672921 RepID=UPI003DA3FC8E
MSNSESSASSDCDKFSNGSNMSDNNSDGGGASDAKYDDICRDYLRNVCKRGKRCRYRHPDNNHNNNNNSKKADYTFCHDFQNTGCRRPSCKFIHCTREEEDYYKGTGQLPVRLQQAAALGLGVQPTELPLMKGEVPICKDYLKGDCKRGARCKYRHISPTEYEYELRRLERRGRSLISTTRFDTYDSFCDRFEFESATSSATAAAAAVAVKRRRVELDDFEHHHHHHHAAATDSIYASIVRPSAALSDYKLLEEENILLRRKIDELRKQCCDLVATNEVLLEQNARYRIAKSNAVSVQAVTSAPTMVTVSRVVTPASTPAPLMSSVNAPLSTCNMVNQLPTSMPQAIALNTDLVSQQVMQQIAQADIASQQAASLPPPQQTQLNHATPVTIVPPVSIQQAALTGAGGVTLASQVSSVQQTQNLPPAAVVSMSASMPQISIPNQTPMVSYPIVSHTQTIASQHAPTHVRQ